MSNHRVGPYELLAPLGAGGMAETFVAVRRGLAGFEQRVCLKRILPGRARDTRFIELFMDEARLLARMRWAGIVQVYDFGEADGTYYMALELVEGTDLDELLRVEQLAGSRIQPEAAMYVAASLLSALAYAHDLTIDGQPLHIIHRDISPSNVLLSAHGEVKLTDFGIAKAHGRTHKTQTGYTKGKPAYMSPEQVRGEPLDRRTDLFSTGIVLYQLVTGEHPFDAPTDLALFNNILSGARRPLREVDPALPAELIALIDGLLEVDPARRPQTAGDALAHISARVQFIAGQRILAERVRKCAGIKSSSRAPTVASTMHAGSTPAVPQDGSTKLLPSDPMRSAPTAEAHAHVAKNTTSRPLSATNSEARARRVLGFASGALLGALILGWIVVRDPRLTSDDARSAQSYDPPVRALRAQEERGGANLGAPDHPASGVLAVHDGGAFALPVSRPGDAQRVPAPALAAPPDAGTKDKRSADSPRPARRRRGNDAGQRVKPWIEVRRDEF